MAISVLFIMCLLIHDFFPLVSFFSAYFYKFFTIIFLFFKFIFIFGCAGFVLHGLFSSCGGGAVLHCSAGFSHCGAQALRLKGFSSCPTWALQLGFPDSRAQAQQLWCTGLVLLSHVGSSWTGIKSMSPALAGRFFTTEPPGKPFL